METPRSTGQRQLKEEKFKLECKIPFLVVLFLVVRGYPRKDKKKQKEEERAVYLFPKYLLVLGMLVISDDYDG